MSYVREALQSRRSRAGAGIGTSVAVLGVMLVAEQPAFAYIDPGTGSLIYQALLAGLLGLGFAFRRTTDTVRTFAQNWFGNRGARSEKSRTDPS
jgi:hypothetical protein